VFAIKLEWLSAGSVVSWVILGYYQIQWRSSEHIDSAASANARCLFWRVMQNQHCGWFHAQLQPVHPEEKSWEVLAPGCGDLSDAKTPNGLHAWR
jgi:hypothetical protein